ncbi:YczE/YyaS/YitT family protein [Enterococcus sp. BWR-S5]|uniref:YczE/YyaS/YitT family protein n=1 Tax=Enterococcus sp. BWR-S5 TaxID=2787714 RepID=UPI0019221276|nr:YitT family protein [Enterococcus sp. BWR-S5]MBL1223983.1 YitT family protein [Enterococcus sp. BWR-S5]
MKQFVCKVWIVLLGTILMGVAIQLIVTANQGFDSVSTLILGLVKHTTIPFSRWSQLLSLLFLLITFLYDKQLLGFGSLINAVFVGEAIRVSEPILSELSFIQNSLIASFLGFALMALGTAIYLSADFGSGPLEGMMLSVCGILKLSLKKGRIVLDFVIVAAGLALGGRVGIGTLFAVFLLGPMIEWFLIILSKYKK